MIGQLIEVLVYVLFFALVAFGMYWVCTHFFPTFPPALWICGVVLLIMILLFVSGQFHPFHFGATG
jgi:hypothetical protein